MSSRNKSLLSIVLTLHIIHLKLKLPRKIVLIHSFYWMSSASTNSVLFCIHTAVDKSLEWFVMSLIKLMPLSNDKFWTWFYEFVHGCCRSLILLSLHRLWLWVPLYALILFLDLPLFARISIYFVCCVLYFVQIVVYSRLVRAHARIGFALWQPQRSFGTNI